MRQDEVEVREKQRFTFAAKHSKALIAHRGTDGFFDALQARIDRMTLLMMLLVTITMPLSLGDESSHICFAISTFTSLLSIWQAIYAVDYLSIDAPALSDKIVWWNSSIVNDSFWICHIAMWSAILGFGLLWWESTSRRIRLYVLAYVICLGLSLVIRLIILQIKLYKRHYERYSKYVQGEQYKDCNASCCTDPELALREDPV